MTSPDRDRRGLSRRRFLATTATAGAAAVLLHRQPARGAAKYTRYNATSPKGQAMLQSYAQAVTKMLALPPTHPHNWFRNAFVHTMDCPHGNWWFFAWHRGYLGYFERTIRALSGNPDFAIPYWDWTQLPRIPDTMFNGVLTPSDVAFNPIIVNYQTFFNFMNPALTAFWKARTPGQVAQSNLRGFTSLDVLWDQVKNNPMYATTNDARYLTRDKPALDPKTAKVCAPETIKAGLAPTTFLKFNSNKTKSHTVPPTSSTVFGILEGQPHNNVHNNIGGVGHVDLAHFGYMQDNLSPTDPIFFLHHSNMDRLWQVWITKQEKLGLPTLPEGQDRVDWERDPFLFFIDEAGKPVTAKAGDYATIGAFDYDYEPGSGDDLVAPAPVAAAPPKTRFTGKAQGATGTVTVGSALVSEAASGGATTLVVKVTLPHPGTGPQRNFDVLVNAPPGVTSVDADSPYYAGTIAFFGGMRHGAMDTTFTLPLTRVLTALKANNALGTGDLRIRVVPQGPTSAGPTPSPGPGVPKASAPAPSARVKAVAVEVL